MAMQKFNRAEKVEVLSKQEGEEVAQKIARTRMVECTCDTPFREICPTHGK